MMISFLYDLVSNTSKLAKVFIKLRCFILIPNVIEILHRFESETKIVCGDCSESP